MVDDVVGDKPILLVGLPRGMTSKAFVIMARMLGRKPPDFTTHGEMLNPQRFRWERSSLPADHPLRERLGGLTGPLHSKSPETFEAVARALDCVPDRWIIKDVVQPWACLDYARRNPSRFTIFYLRRELSHVHFALHRRNWNYVADVDGLDRALSEAFQIISTTAMQFDERYLHERLRQLGVAAKFVEYIDQNFIADRESFFARYYKAYSEAAGEPDEEAASPTRVSRADVAWAYRLLLGRDPESEEVVRRAMKAKTRRELVGRILASPEFQRLSAT